MVGVDVVDIDWSSVDGFDKKNPIWVQRTAFVVVRVDDDEDEHEYEYGDAVVVDCVSSSHQLLSRRYRKGQGDGKCCWSLH